jgi:peptidoglycan/xylan/chitin deacetylase (PgdA/CDA1 family)
VGTSGFLSADEVRELSRRGHDVGSHSDSHPTYMGSLSRAELATEWRRSREALSEILGTPPQTAAVPGGFLSAAVIGEAASAGYRVLMTSQPSVRVRSHEGMQVHGRFTIWAATRPARAAAYARGDRRARAEMWLAWQSKTVSKQLSPAVYESLRRRWAQLKRPGRAL